MSTAYPVENWFRQPVEALPAFSASLAAAALLSHPPSFHLTPTISVLFAAGLFTFSAVRGKEAWKVIRFQRNLKRLPKYILEAGQIPWSSKRVFLGRGFKWGEKHTQRLRDCQRTENEKYVSPGRWYNLARRLELRYEHSPWRYHQHLVKWLATDSPWNPVRPLPDIGGNPAIHGIEPDEVDITMPVADRVGHMVVIGATRVGKTRFAELLITQDIRRGDTVIVFDPKGDGDLLMRVYAEAARAGRSDQFYFFHLGYPELSAEYNPVGSFSRITEVATRIANALPSEGDAASFKNFVWKYVNGIARGMQAMGDKPSYAGLYQHAENPEPFITRYLTWWLDRLPEAKGWRSVIEKMELNEKNMDRAMKQRGTDLVKLIEYIRKHQLYDNIASSLLSVVTYEQSYFNKLVASLYPFLEKVTTGKLADLISPDYDNPSGRARFDWATILANGGIVYVGLDSLEDQAVGSAVGNAMFGDLVSQASKIYKHGTGYGHMSQGPKRKLSIHADEFNELIGDEFIPMVNKAGGAGYQVTVYTQTWSDVEAKIGSAAKAEQIQGNFNTLHFLRTLQEKTAEILTKKLPDVTYRSIMPVSGTSDTNDPTKFEEFSSKNEDRITAEKIPMLTPADLAALPKGQAFSLIEGGQLVKIRIPLASSANDEYMPEDLKVVALDMKKRYLRNTLGFEAEPMQSKLIVNGRGSGF